MVRPDQCGDVKYCALQIILITDVGKNKVETASGQIWISNFRHTCLLWVETV